MRNHAVVALIPVLFLLGCEDSVHLTEPSDTGGGGTGADSGGAGGGAVPTARGTGTYSGYLENYQTTSGTDRVRVVIAEATTKRVSGRVMFGTGTPPPVEDPEAGYPPGDPRVTPSSEYDPVSGFQFAIKSGSLRDDRLVFDFNLADQYAEWCAAQTSYSAPWAWEGVTHACVPSQPSFDTDACTVGSGNDLETVDCGKAVLCGYVPVCDCDSDGCQARSDYLIHVDLQLGEGQADGSVNLNPPHMNSRLVGVHLDGPE